MVCIVARNRHHISTRVSPNRFVSASKNYIPYDNSGRKDYFSCRYCCALFTLTRGYYPLYISFYGSR